jgi:5-methylthioadenosine/S-adenosylhomocysteine deaminase
VNRILVTGGVVVTQNAARRIIPDGCVIVEGTTIAAVGPAALAEGVDGERIDARGCAVIPGLVNAHTHLYNTFGRTLGADQTFGEWLPTQKGLIATLDEDEFRACVELGMIDNLRSGTTCIVDNPAVPAASENRLHEAALGAARDLGARYVLARGYTDQMNAPEYVEPLVDIERRMRALVRDHHDTASGRLRVMLSPMLPWALSLAGFTMTRRLADELGVRIHMHTAETAAFADLIEKAHGHRSNVRLDRDGGCLGPDVQLLGCAWLTPDEIRMVTGTGTAVLLDPTAAMFIGAGMPPLLALLDAGVPAGLATNGPAANGGQDMFESMKNAAGLAKVAAGDGRACTQQRALDLATVEGARALGLDGTIGSLERDKRADLAIVDLSTPFVAPALDVVTALVSACKGRDVRDVMIDGRVVVRDRRLTTGDEARIVERATTMAAGAAQRAGLTARLRGVASLPHP